MLSDISDTGARLDVPYPDKVPDRFMLWLTETGAARRTCHVVWRKLRQIGVRFERRLPRATSAPTLEPIERRRRRQTRDSRREADALSRASGLLDRRQHPGAAARAQEGPQLRHLFRAAALDDAAAGAIDHAVGQREAHRDGGVFVVALAPGFGQVALQKLDVGDLVDDAAAGVLAPNPRRSRTASPASRARAAR